MTPLLLLAAAGVTALLAGAVVTGLFLRTRRDAVTLLTVYLALLFVLPAPLVIAPMGAVGSPALIAGIGLAGLWAAAKVTPESGLDRGWQPIRVAVVIYAGVMLASSANGFLRPLTELEQSGSSRALLTLASLVGVALLAADGITSQERLETLLRRLVLLAAIVGVIGIVQFVTGWDPTRYIRLPGLALNHNLVGISERSIFNRPWSTTQHPIEFGVVLGALFPLALHYAFHAPTPRARVGRWAMAFIVAAAVPMTVSRSGVVAIGVAMAVMALGWSWRRRVNVAAGAMAFTVFMWAVIPGLIGTLRSLFLNMGHDPSVVARQERIPRVVDLVADHPWLGYGFGTFSVEEYLLVDNEIFVTAISTGLIGLTVFVGLIIFSGVIAFDVRRLTQDAPTRHLALAIAAGLAGLLVCMATFDAFFYRMFTGTMFLLLGAAGALWRLTRQQRDHPADDAATGARSASNGSGNGASSSNGAISRTGASSWNGAVPPPPPA